jgi:hypothetical protein
VARRAGLAWLLLVGGCAERGVASGPTSSHGPGTWAAVAVAATAAALVWAVLLVAPAGRRGGSGFAAGILAVQAGAAIVGGAVLTGTAVRSAQLVTQPAGAERATSLVQLSGLDGGDVDFFRLMAVLTVLLGGLLVVVLTLAAQYAAGVDPVRRTLACCVLAVEALISALAVVLGLLGHHSWPFAVTAAALPALVLAIVKCWPHREADEGQLGYNGGHG